MKIYNCDVCRELVYFENFRCLNCGYDLGFLPALDNMSSLEYVDGILWKALLPEVGGKHFRKCDNYQYKRVCNWMISHDDPNNFCLSCSLNEIIPDLSLPENHEYWHRLEVAKRRLVYSLLRFGLPVKNKNQDPEKGLSFSFLADEISADFVETEKIFTGHRQGKIVMNISEANDAFREKTRLDLKEFYRTLLGHFRHEIGHYYWYLFIENNSDYIDKFRNIFGNEHEDYDQALKFYYSNGAPPDWQQNYISAYASSHPLEDWAESWAHYLHMFDTLETASSWGMSVKINKGEEQKALNIEHHVQTFEEMRDQWFYLSCAINSLNRSMGMKDVYPFVWSERVIEKLSFIQQVIINFSEGDSR